MDEHTRQSLINDETQISNNGLYIDKTRQDNNDISNLTSIRLKCPKNIILSYLNINSIRNKFNDLSYLLKDKVDLLTIAETKIDESFPTGQFIMPGYKNLTDLILIEIVEAFLLM